MIYVDELKEYDWVVWGKETANCHMFTDGDLEELHIFANKIGMKKEWIHNSKHPHYDLTPSKRKLAVEYGAKEITTKDWMKRERAKIISDAMAKVAFEILDPEFSNIEKKILAKIDGINNIGEFIVNEPEAEIMAANHLIAINIKRDEKGKIVSLIWGGYKFKVSQFIPTRDSNE